VEEKRKPDDDGDRQRANRNTESKTLGRNPVDRKDDRRLVAYANRWDWYKAVLRQPNKVLTATTKTVLLAIFEATDRASNSTTRYQQTLAKAVGGLTVRGVQKCIGQAEAAGFIEVFQRGGGLVHGDNGKTRGIANSYRMTLPRTIVQGIDETTLNSGATYPEPPFQQPRTTAAATPNHGSHNTPSSSPSISPHISPEHVREECDLPTASQEIRAAWGERWPPDDVSVSPHRNSSFENAMAWVGVEACVLLGYSTTLQMPAESGHRYRDSWIRSKLPKKYVAELARLMQSGRLTAVQLANVLACCGFTPKAGPSSYSS